MIFDLGRKNPAASRASKVKSGNRSAPDPNVRGVMSNDSPINEDDIVIAVMGPTGAGKSSFVNMVARREEVVVGHSLKSQTREVRTVRCRHPDGRNIVLVDTPGFDDTYLSDTEILKNIATWLKDTYKGNIKLTGLLYLHRIIDVRMAGTPLRNLSVFRELCGSGNLRNVVLVSTMWDELNDQADGSQREEQLLSGFWKPMISMGSRSCRFERTAESAWKIIELFDLMSPRPKLQIQTEMVDRNLPFQETAAAKTLFHSLMEEIKKLWEKLRRPRRQASSRKPADSRPRRSLSRRSTTPPTPVSISSERSCDTVSLFANTDTSSIYSRDSDSSMGGRTYSGCSSNGRRSVLPETIKCLSLAYGIAEFTPIPLVQELITAVLSIAQLIEGMDGMHHVIIQVVECSGWLLEIVRYTAESTLQLPEDVERTLVSFKRVLHDLQIIVEDIRSKNSVSPFVLRDEEIETVTMCIASIKQIYDIPEVKRAMKNHDTITRFDDRMAELYNVQVSKKCECGISVSVVPEE